ncbi:MAG: beta-ketoacyl synthase N-terminal-like domain-containing protein, partial [Candidatus Sericytochromatia bacterium]
NAAEPIHAATVASFNAAFATCGLEANSQAPAYGMAETAVFISISPPECRPLLLAVDREALEAGRVLMVSEDHPRAQKLVACGRTWLEARLLIVDPERSVDIGEDAVGEIWIQGPHVALGYWNQPEASAETFQASLQDQPGHFLRTGDLGFVHAGEVYVTGRRKDLIIVRGRNLYPQDLERSIDQLRAQLPEIRPGCGVAFAHQVPDAEFVEAETSSALPAAEEVVFYQEITADEQSLDSGRLEALSRRIAETLVDEHLIPVQAVVLVKPGTLPKTSSGKLMRQACRQAYARGLDTSPIQVLFHWRAHGQHASAEVRSASAGAPAPANQPAHNTDWRRWLLDWLSQACRLPVDTIDLDQRFQTLGLDSLLSVRLVADLEQMGLGTLPGPLPDTLLWEYPTPRALLGFLAGVQEGAQNLAPLQEIPFTNEPIAVISMACRFPGGASSPEAFWELLESGRDAIGPIPASRWDVEAFYDPQQGLPGKMYLREGGFLEDVDRFEPGFFKISPREAVNMDPQQRLLLELAWELLEAAGIPAGGLEQSSTGVFIGLSNVDYALLGHNERINVYTGTGNAPSVAAGRLSCWLELQGPVMTLDTACSSSLVAVHQACQSLRLGECSLAMAGGVNLILSPEVNIYFCQLQALASDGRSKSFDAGADGFVRSEGGGLVLLKRLSDALRDQDPILGLVCGSAVNHDGPSNGLTAPNGRAQQQVIRQALRQAGVAAEAVSFVETHGTGTPLGDPIEVQALGQVMLGANRVTPLYLGALKSNLGHLESAAGVAGLIKTLLALRHRTLPANLHFQQLNPRIEADPRLHFPTTATPWTAATPRLAGISSFGISGTNAHLILEEYPEPVASEGPNPEHQVYPIMLSAHSEAALIARLGQILAWLSLHKSERNLLRDLAFTTSVRRDHLRHRWAMLARDPDALFGALSAGLEAGAADLIAPLNDPVIGFVFPGQGAQWPGMGRELYAREAVFREAIARCEAAFAAEVDWRLSEVLETATAEDYARLELIQPVIFAIQVGLSALWQSWGLKPQVVIGHSMGEVAAAYLAGALSLEDAARIICRRSWLLGRQSQQSAGGMLFTALTPAACEGYLSKEIMIGVYNGPDATVLTGERQALEDLAQTLADQEIFARFVQVPVAAHSWQIDSFEAPLKAALAELQPHAPAISMLSTVTAGPLEAPPGPDYWYDNLRQPVRFGQTVERALAEGVNLWIEISPHPLLLQTLQSSARQAQKS